MRKKILKFIKAAVDKAWVRFILYVSLLLGVFGACQVLNGNQLTLTSLFTEIFEIAISRDTLAVILAALASLFFARVLKHTDKYLEESNKVNDDHRSIIGQYSGHSKETIDNKNFYDEQGTYMTLRCIDNKNKNKIKNSETDKYSDKYKNLQTEIDNFKNKKRLTIPTLNVLANINGDVELSFNDAADEFVLPNFVIINSTSLLSAHENSFKANNKTVRLVDLKYDDDNKTAVLKTQRTTYFHMLMTNRCMDFEVHQGVSIRTAYEYLSMISALPKSKLSNQIGINGLVISSDGYVLIEKRGNVKATWKNKFAQSISLAFKTKDLIDEEVVNDADGNEQIIKNGYDEANKTFKKIILKTLKENFGFIESDFKEFDIRSNFLGVARDLLEGGKPNLYFYIVTRHTAKKLSEILEGNAKRDEISKEGRKPLKSKKLSCDYYLVPFKDIKIGFDYSLEIDRRKTYWPRRHMVPRSKRRRALLSFARHKAARIFMPKLRRECGEALLATISYLELCKDRIDALKRED